MSLYNELKRRSVFRVGAAYSVVSWLLIQMAETILPLFGFDDSAARLVVITLSILFLPAVILAWVFQLTPKGIKVDHGLDSSQPIPPHTGKKLDRVIIVVLAIAIGYFAFDKFALSELRETSIAEAARQEGRTEALVASFGDRSIAVLPFINMSDDASNEFFSDGISEELLNLLARIPELRVISRSSAFSYKGKDTDIPTIAAQLNVGHILEGSVRKAGNKVRITTQLIEARSDTHLWSETFDRQLDDIFAIQDEISAAVVAQLKIVLLGEAPFAKETDPEAYALFLQTRHLSRKETAEATIQAMQQYQQVLAIAPDFADAWAELGLSQVNQSALNLTSKEIGFAQARESFIRALEIDPDNAAVHSRLGWIAMAQGDWEAAAKQMQLALQLDPGKFAVLGNAGQLLSNLGRHEQAIQMQKRALATDPANARAHWNMGYVLFTGERMDEALVAAEITERLSPGFGGGPNIVGNIYLYRKDYESALMAFSREGIEELRIKGRAMAYFSLGRTDEFKEELKQLQDDWRDKRPSEIAAVYVWIGDFDTAFEWLDRAAQIGDRRLFYFIQNPLLTGIHEDNRWLPFLEKIGKSPQQLAAIEFEVTLP